MSASENLLRGVGAPVLLKETDPFPWPGDERLFYLLGRDGLYLCRNHEFFQSCVKTTRGPSGLEVQRPFLRPRFPLIPRDVFERVVGFFSRIADRQNSEAAAFLVWDRSAECVRIVVPRQVATMSRAWDGYRSPIGVHYELPTDLGADWIPFADVHSHVDFSAYSSSTDVADEVHAAGLHIVVGRIQNEPPQIHVEAVVDGQRFAMPTEQVIEGYAKRDLDVPEEWLDRVRIEEASWGSPPPVLS